MRELEFAVIPFVNEKFMLKSRYRIFNRDVELWWNKNRFYKPLIRASSVSNETYMADTLLEESGAIWHSKSPPDYPQWLEFEYQKPVIINKLVMYSQEGAPQRGPSEFYFQGQDERGRWRDLLTVSHAGFTDTEGVKSWAIQNKEKFKHYRLYILKNSGSPDFVTIRHIDFEYVFLDVKDRPVRI